MSSYNLKAKSRHTAEVRDFIAIDMQYDYRYETPDGLIGYTSKEFNTLYEVINDTPIEKGWRDATKDIEIAKLFHDTYEKLAPDFGYETRKDTKQFDPFSNNGRLMIEVCGRIYEFIEQQAYARGQEEAYSKSAEVARGEKHKEADGMLYSQIHAFNTGKEQIAQAIEQLASNKE